MTQIPTLCGVYTVSQSDAQIQIHQVCDLKSGFVGTNIAAAKYAGPQINLQFMICGRWLKNVKQTTYLNQAIKLAYDTSKGTPNSIPVLAANFLVKLFQDSQSEKKFCGKLYSVREDGTVVTNLYNYEIWIGATQLTCSKNILPQRKLVGLIELSPKQVPQLKELYDFADRIGDSTLSSEFMDQLLGARRVMLCLTSTGGYDVAYADNAMNVIGQAYLKCLSDIPSPRERFLFEIGSELIYKCYQIVAQAACLEFKEQATPEFCFNAIRAVSDGHLGGKDLPFTENCQQLADLIAEFQAWNSLVPHVYLFPMNCPLFGPAKVVKIQEPKAKVPLTDAQHDEPKQEKVIERTVETVVISTKPGRTQGGRSKKF